MNITVGKLISELKSAPIDALVVFGGEHPFGLEFYRVKMRGEKLTQIEFNQQVYRDEKGEWVVDDLDGGELAGKCLERRNALKGKKARIKKEATTPDEPKKPKTPRQRMSEKHVSRSRRKNSKLYTRLFVDRE
jgi:hypothetical protein